MMKKSRKTIRTQIAQYICTFQPRAHGAYGVRCAAFPGIITSGATLEEARYNAREALELCLEVYKDKGWKIPPPDVAPLRTIRELIPTAFSVSA